MNYRHAFHAGSFADVHKHVTLALVLSHLREKETAFRVIDTHAGIGLYDLHSEEAERTGEWREGIGRLLAAPLQNEPASLLAPYLEAIASLNAPGELRCYPGSPALARAMLRRQDRMIACESEPVAADQLASLLKGDHRCKAIRIDAWTALTAYIPPVERRGLVLIDPPYEQPGEMARLAQAIPAAYRKWATGIFMLWYPIKDRRETEALARALVQAQIAKVLRTELSVAPVAASGRLGASGLLVINPPWKLHRQLAELLPWLATLLGREDRGEFRLEWLAGEA